MSALGSSKHSTPQLCVEKCTVYVMFQVWTVRSPYVVMMWQNSIMLLHHDIIWCEAISKFWKARWVHGALWREGYASPSPSTHIQDTSIQEVGVTGYLSPYGSSNWRIISIEISFVHDNYKLIYPRPGWGVYWSPTSIWLHGYELHGFHSILDLGSGAIAL